jgi:CubicO group peptidase (beta-lactamase class C family)
LRKKGAVAMLKKIVFAIAFISLPSFVTAATEVVVPVFNPSGPEAESVFCEKKGYPVAWKYSKDPCYRIGTFSNFNQLVPTSVIRRKEPIWQLAYANKNEVDATLERLADEALNQLPITSLIIWRAGKIQKEVYQYGRKDTDLFSSFSMHKTVSGLLIDVAIEKKLIGSVDDNITDYLPALAATDWQSRSIFHALTMTSGIGQDQAGLYLPLFFKDADRAAVLASLAKNERFKAGEKFEYSDLDTFALGLIAEKVFGAPQGEIISDVLWQRIGAESDAQILTTKSGQHLLASNLRARSRDYLRLGLLIANGGRNHQGERVISEKWMEALFGDNEKVARCPMGRSCRKWAYSYQTWLPPIPKVAVAIGKYGQYIAVSKATNTVIVITSADGAPGLAYRPRLMQLFRAASGN